MYNLQHLRSPTPAPDFLLPFLMPLQLNMFQQAVTQHRQMCYVGAEDPVSPLRTALAALLKAVSNLVLQAQQLFVVDTQQACFSNTAFVFISRRRNPVQPKNASQYESKYIKIGKFSSRVCSQAELNS